MFYYRNDTCWCITWYKIYFFFIYFLYKNRTWNVENIISIYFLGTPKYNGNMKEIIKNALREAMIYKDCQVVNC